MGGADSSDCMGRRGAFECWLRMRAAWPAIKFGSSRASCARPRPGTSLRSAAIPVPSLRPATLIIVDGRHPGIADLTDTPVPCRVAGSRTEPRPQSLPLLSPPPSATRQPPPCRPLPSPDGGHDRNVLRARVVRLVEPAVKSETGGRAQLERRSDSRAQHSYDQSSLYLARWP